VHATGNYHSDERVIIACSSFAEDL